MSWLGVGWSLLGHLAELGNWLLIGGGVALLVIGAVSKTLGGFWPPFALVRGPVAVLARWLGVALIVLGCARLWLGSHDAAVLAARDAQEAAAVATARDEEHRTAVAALETAQREAVSRVRTVTVIKEKIAHVPVQTGCAGSPAIAAALDGLHRPVAAGGSGATAGGAGDPAGVSGPARAPQPAAR